MNAAIFRRALRPLGALALLSAVALGGRAVWAQQSPPPAAPSDGLIVRSPDDVDMVVDKALEKAAKAQADTDSVLSRSFFLSTGLRNALPDKRIDVDIKDMPLRDALRKVLDEAKIAYRIDDDVPNDTRVSLKIAGTTLADVLDLLTRANSIGWRAEMTTVEAAPAPEPGKPALPEKAAVAGPPVRVHVGKNIESLPRAFRLGVLDVKGMPGGDLRYALPPSAPAPPNASYLLRYHWNEERATFTCPYCHNSITILRQPEKVLCPTCGRPFAPDWKVCPYDGTKRPVRKDEWHFCPICGKPIKAEDQQTSWVTVPVSPQFAAWYGVSGDNADEGLFVVAPLLRDLTRDLLAPFHAPMTAL